MSERKMGPRLQHRRVKEIFLEVCGMSRRDQKRFLDAACAEEAQTRAEVESLLRYHDAAAQTERGLGLTPRAENVDGSSAPAPIEKSAKPVGRRPRRR